MDYQSVAIAKQVLNRLLLSNGVRFSETTTAINIRCPHCGDSSKSKSVRKGFFVFQNTVTGWMFYYKCQRGSCEFNKAISITTYLRRFHPKAYDEFKALLRGDKNQQNSGKSFSTFNWKKMEDEQRAKVEAETKKRLAFEAEQTQYFIPLSSNPESAIERHYITNAVRYCQLRKLPESRYMKFFVAIDGKYQNRIVVPFYRKDEKPSYFQCRSMDGSEPKYLNRYGTKQFYNITLVDWERPVVATEGAFDSMFFDNSFALNGISSESDEFKKLDKTKILLLLDNDSAGSTTSSKMIKAGYSVFLWRKFIADYPVVRDHMQSLFDAKKPCKCDWNDVVKLLNKNDWKPEEIIKYFSRNPLDIPFIRGYRDNG